MSKWLDWRRARWQKKPVPDFLVDDDGTFYCDCGCQTLAQHEAKSARRDNPDEDHDPNPVG